MFSKHDKTKVDQSYKNRSLKKMERHMDKKVSNFSIQVDNFFVSRFSLSEVENQILFSVTIDPVIVQLGAGM